MESTILNQKDLTVNKSQENAPEVSKLVDDKTEKHEKEINSVQHSIDNEENLFTIIRLDNLKGLQKLLNDISTDINIRDPDTGDSILHWAVKYSSVLCIDSLLDANPNINVVNADGKTAVELQPIDVDGNRVIYRIKLHLVKLCAAKIFINKENAAAIGGNIFPLDFIIYWDEIQIMKNTPILPLSHINFCDVILMTVRKLSEFLELTDKEIIQQSNYSTKFPSYASIITYKLMRTFQYKNINVLTDK